MPKLPRSSKLPRLLRLAEREGKEWLGVTFPLRVLQLTVPPSTHASQAVIVDAHVQHRPCRRKAPLLASICSNLIKIASIAWSGSSSLEILRLGD